MHLFENLANDSILILGLGREGHSTFRYLRSLFPNKHLSVADQNFIQSEEIINDKNTTLHFGADYLKYLSDYKIIFKTPGISLKNINVPIHSVITSQTDMFLQMYSQQIVGVTGTKGKSTTTALIYHFLKKAGKHVLSAGNMGTPLFDIINEIRNDTLIVCELSSHQLEYIQKGPYISILLNIYQEHLDFYASYFDYQKAKLNIALCQSKSDIFIFHADDSIINSNQNFNFISSCKIPFGSTPQIINRIIDDDIIIHQKLVGKWKSEFSLKGKHNKLNVVAALTACEALGLSPAELVLYISEFKTLPHRMEYVGCYCQIHFYNDSIATIPEATLGAIEAIPEVETIILGGYDRGIDYGSFIKIINEKGFKNVIFTGNAGKRMMKILKEAEKINSNYFFCDNYETIIKTAIENTTHGKACLLSPAASSYDLFNNFEHRGDTYKLMLDSYFD